MKYISDILKLFMLDYKIDKRNFVTKFLPNLIKDLEKKVASAKHRSPYGHKNGQA